MGAFRGAEEASTTSLSSLAGGGGGGGTKTTTSIVAVPDVRRHAVVLRCRPSITIAMLAIAFVASVAVGIVDVIEDELARLGPILSTLPGAMIDSNA